MGYVRHKEEVTFTKTDEEDRATNKMSWTAIKDITNLKIDSGIITFHVKEGRVYFQDRTLRSADIDSFQVSEHDAYMAKDTKNVYFGTGKIKGADAASFEELANGYCRDAYRAYYRLKSDVIYGIFKV